MNILIQMLILIALAFVGPRLLWSNPAGYFSYSFATFILSAIVLIRPLPRLWLGSRIEQTLHQSEGSFGGQVMGLSA